MKNALCLGTFDGVHKGHLAVLDIPQEYRKIAVTFKEPPKSVVSGNCELIITESDKETALKKCGVDEILNLDFNAVRDTLPLDFLCELKQRFNPSLISCGFNYRFGKAAAGDTGTIAEFCRENNILFNCVQSVCEDDMPVSSTYIRNLLKSGEIAKANSLMRFPFSFEAEVTEGNHLGRTIGFPTVNQKYPEKQFLHNRCIHVRGA